MTDSFDLDRRELLPPLFSTKSCAACGLGTHSGMPTKFCTQNCYVEEGEIIRGTSRTLGPHMHRTCTQCQFSWLEASKLSDSVGAPESHDPNF